MKVAQRIIGIALVALGLIFAFSTIGVLDPQLSGSIATPVCVLGIFLFIYSFGWSNHGERDYGKMPKVPREDVIKDKMGDDLETYLDCLLKIFFNEDHTERIIFYKEDNDVRLAKEKLYFFSEDEYRFVGMLAIWEGYDLGLSFYDSLETALKENKTLLEGFTEVKTDFFYLNDNKRHLVEVKWNLDWKAFIPFSMRYRPQIRVEGSNDRDVALMCFGHSKDKTMKAIMYYIVPKSENSEDTLEIGTSFEVREGPKVVGTGTVIGYLE